ncbi:ankyrin repeat domain-containing protein [Wolbachia endosymbiont of Rhagoletis indifferens]|uniref:ankyrin repeat domain-containing protein n=1 Tax=Wolbachia endosymbiont of Rhagoletis indifferens TaxID=3383250 RepID=UPI003AF402F9
MNRKEALKILGFNEGDHPSEREITVAYRKLALEYHPDKHSGASKDVQKQNEEKFKELGAAYNFLTGNDVKEATTFSGEDLDRVSSTDDLLILLHFAIFNKQKDFLEKLLSRFKSGEGEEFGDYINEKNFTTFDNSPLYIACLLGYTDIVTLLLKHKANPDLSKDYTPLLTACSMGRADVVEILLKYKANPNLSSGPNNFLPLLTVIFSHTNDSNKENYIKITELLLKYGADPNTLVEDSIRVIECTESNILKRTFMLHGNNKIKKLMVQYGGVDRHYLFTYGLFATCFTSCMIIHVSSIYKLSNYEIPICIFAILFCTYRALEAAFFAKTKEPSPEFAEVITEKVVNNVGLNAEDNSKRIDNALA